MKLYINSAILFNSKRDIHGKRWRLKKLTQIFVDARFVHAVSCVFRALKHTWRLLAVIRRHIFENLRRTHGRIEYGWTNFP